MSVLSRNLMTPEAVSALFTFIFEEADWGATKDISKLKSPRIGILAKVILIYMQCCLSPVYKT